MNEDRVAGAARDWVGKAEHGLGDTVGSDTLKSDGLVDQTAGAIQHGYGVVKDAVAGTIDNAPDAFAVPLDRGRKFGRKSDEAVREKLGANGSLYLLAGVVTVFAIGAFGLTLSSSAKPVAKRRGARSHN